MSDQFEHVDKLFKFIGCTIAIVALAIGIFVGLSIAAAIVGLK